MAPRPNILLITLDQFRGDSLSAAGHPVVMTPHLDTLAREGVRFAAHYSQASPCSPGRAALYTGTYQMNNRVVANGTPLDAGFDNVALAARRAGYEPVMFGYTDQSIDPRLSAGPEDPRLSTYEGVLPGFSCLLDLSESHAPWLEWLAERGHPIPNAIRALSTEHTRSSDLSVSTFMTDTVIDWLSHQDQGWFAHASYVRPHPPYSAAGEFGSMYPESEVGMPIELVTDPEPFHHTLLQLETTRAPQDEAELRRMRAQYFGMISEVDQQLGRIWDWLKRTGAWENTLVIVTSDHGEMLGDHGLKEKVGYWESSQHIPCIVHDPRNPRAYGSVVRHFTENVDIMPTVCEAMGVGVPHQCDGLPLTPFLAGQDPPWWRTAAHWEYDWRFALIELGVNADWPWKRTLERQNLCVHRTEDLAYVQFGDGRHLCFDLAVDPTWRTQCVDEPRVMRAAQELLAWRMQTADRRHTGFLVQQGGMGRWPAGVPWRDGTV